MKALSLESFGNSKSPTRLEGMETFCYFDGFGIFVGSPTRLEGMETINHHPPQPEK